MKTKRQFTMAAMALTLCAAAGPLQAAMTVYDFGSHLTGLSTSTPTLMSSLSSTDNWRPLGNADALIKTEISYGSFNVDGSIVGYMARHNADWDGGVLLIRPNDASFSIPSFTGTETAAVIQFTVATTNDDRFDFNTGFGLGYYPTGTDLSTAEGSALNAALGPMVVRYRESLGFIPAGSTDAIKVTAFPEDKKDSVAEVRLVMHLATNTGSVEYRMTLGSGDWTSVVGLTDINLGLDLNATDARNPANWNSMVMRNKYPTRGGATNLTVESIPEPASLVMMGFGGLLVLASARRKSI